MLDWAGKTAQSITNGGAAVVLTNWTEVSDSSGAGNPVTGTFTAPFSGRYTYACSSELSASGLAQLVGTWDGVGVLVNSVPVTDNYSAKSVGDALAQSSVRQEAGALTLTAGDQVQFYRRHTFSAAANDTTAATKNWAHIHFVSSTY